MFAKLAKYPADTQMLLLITSIGALVIFCLSVFRALLGNIPIALLDFYYFSGVSICTWYIIETGRTRKASIFLMLISYTAIIPIIYLSGPKEVNWIYPIMVAAFFLLKPGEALGLNLLALLLCVPQFSSLWNSADFLFYMMPMVLINVFSFMFAKKIWIQKTKMEELATKDPLTGTGNRRALSENMSQILMMHKRRGTKVSLISFDIDHFKLINDNYGHPAGDEVLVAITDIINERIRSTDSLYRQGGEEFIIVAMDATRNIASKLAEELRQMIENKQLHAERVITVSFGVAELCDGETQKEWVERVDTALYNAKKSGRNTVCVS